MTKTAQKKYQAAKTDAEAWGRAANRAETMHADPALAQQFRYYQMLAIDLAQSLRA